MEATNAKKKVEKTTPPLMQKEALFGKKTCTKTNFYSRGDKQWEESKLTKPSHQEPTLTSLVT